MSLLYIERRETPSLCKGRSVSLLYIEKADESVSSLDLERMREDSKRQGHGQGKPRHGKPRARQALPVSCLALPGESLLSVETI